MAQSHKDGSSVKDILHQFQAQQDGYVEGKRVKTSESKPMKLRGAGVEPPIPLVRPSIKQIPKNVVNQKVRCFQRGDSGSSQAADDERQVSTSMEEDLSQRSDSERPRKPPAPKRPPLAKKPPASVERKPRVIGPKPKLHPDKSSAHDTADRNLGLVDSSEDSGAVNESQSKENLPACSDSLSHNANHNKEPGQELTSYLYSKVDRSKKTKYRQSSEGVKKVDSNSVDDIQKGTRSVLKRECQVDPDLDESLGGEYAKLRESLDSQDMKTSSQSPVSVPPQTDRSPLPPKKPPRTFAHDDYMMQKQLKLQQKKAAKEAEKQRQNETKPNTDEFGYEYVDVQAVPKSSVKSQTIHRLPSVEERSKAKQVIQKPSERPPPPPRPPPPSPKSTLSGGPLEPERFKKAVVYVKEHNTLAPKTAFLLKKHVTNPSYEADWEIIRIKHPKSDGETKPTGVLKRCKSDECLYVEPDIKLGEPIYMDPVDAVGKLPNNVILDAEGYAIPEEVKKSVVNGSRGNRIVCRMNSTVPELPVIGQGNISGDGHYSKMSPNCSTALRFQSQPGRKPVQEKLSKAYSVLRLNLVQSDVNADVNKEMKDDDSDNEVNPDEQNERLKYVSTVKLRLSMAVNNSPYRTPEELRMKLFNYAAIIGLEKLEDVNRYKTKWFFHFPHQTTEEIETISQFCFPDLQAWRPVTKYKSETFSFVLTDEHAKRRYGYCMRFLPPGTGNRLPIVLCIVSALDAFMFYKRLLDEIREKYKISPDHAELLIQAAYATPLPEPGKEAWVVSEGANDKRETVFLKRPADTRQDSVSFTSLLTCLSIDNLISVFASVLLERKIIFVAQHLSTLTSCIQAVCALLYPFTWPHPYVPVLPAAMIEVCQSPTPIIVGVLTTQQPKLADLNIEHVLMIDLDHNTLMMCQGDESRIIPKKLQKALRLALKDDGDISSQAHDMLVRESFLRFFVETIGHYTEYICTQMDGEKIFEKKAFITSVSSKSIRMFLEWFVETQMFEVFITDKMETSNSIGTFETRILEYREEMQDTPTIKQNVKEMGRRVKNFFLTSGDKIRKKFSSNVFI